MVVSRNTMSASVDRNSGGATTVSKRSRPILFHLHRHVKDFQRARAIQTIHRGPEELRVHVVDLTLDHDDPIDRQSIGGLADQDPENIRRLRIVARARPIAHVLDRQRRDRDQMRKRTTWR